ncbi:hypothetical protein QBC34DRAFT_465189 [Podospora aff. communis PSN243]|uniref:Uncharacterized protein n=1 Tax=Podospora aff. communis PSN243 TaxID=3040156 RepID=A0AAV9H631_9PEZI|nr:hypothetical protein QBC34DRAFT_465189 [Podospora aff. communis PSN243]
MAAMGGVVIATPGTKPLELSLLTDAAHNGDAQLLHRQFERPAEHAVLADCTSSNGPQSQLAYYFSAPNNAPDDTTTGANKPQGSWAGAGKVTGNFGNGTPFWGDLTAGVGEGQFAGVADNSYHGFYCYRRTRSNLYSRNGMTCTGAYDCNHTEPPHHLSTSDLDDDPW